MGGAKPVLYVSCPWCKAWFNTSGTGTGYMCGTVLDEENQSWRRSGDCRISALERRIGRLERQLEKAVPFAEVPKVEDPSKEEKNYTDIQLRATIADMDDGLHMLMEEATTQKLLKEQVLDLLRDMYACLLITKDEKPDLQTLLVRAKAILSTADTAQQGEP